MAIDRHDTGPDEVNCAACGAGNFPRERSSGHEYPQNNHQAFSGAATHPNSGDIVEREDIADVGGCWWCGCPEWDAGGRITWGKFRPGSKDRPSSPYRKRKA